MLWDCADIKQPCLLHWLSSNNLFSKLLWLSEITAMSPKVTSFFNCQNPDWRQWWSFLFFLLRITLDILTPSVQKFNPYIRSEWNLEFGIRLVNTFAAWDGGLRLINFITRVPAFLLYFRAIAESVRESYSMLNTQWPPNMSGYGSLAQFSEKIDF